MTAVVYVDDEQHSVPIPFSIASKDKDDPEIHAYVLEQSLSWINAHRR